MKTFPAVERTLTGVINGPEKSQNTVKEELLSLANRNE